MDCDILSNNKQRDNENVRNSSKMALLEAMKNTDDYTIISDSDGNKSNTLPGVGSHSDYLESKIEDFMNRTDSKLDMLMRQSLDKTNQYQNTVLLGDRLHGSACENCELLRSQHELSLKLNIDKEKEVLVLKEELSKKDNIIQELQKEIKCLSMELNTKTKRLRDLRQANNTGLEAKIIQLEIATSKQNLQLSALQEQNNMLGAQNKLKDQMVCSKQIEVNRMLQEMKKTEIQRSCSFESPFSKLKSHPKTTRENLRNVEDPTICCGDVVIIHDLFQKGFNANLLKNTNIVVKEIWSNRLKDALSSIQNMKSKPKLVLLHTGTKDLLNLTEEEMVKIIVEIYETLIRKNIKFVWSNLIPRSNDLELNSKGYFVNRKIEKVLSNKPGAYIERNEHFYLRDMLHPSIIDILLDE